MALQPQPYQGANDFAAMRYILTEGRKASRHSGYVHTGDLNWWLYYLLPSKRYELHEIAYVWRDGDTVVGWSLFTPGDALFDLFMHPSERYGERRAHMLSWTLDHAVDLARRHGLSDISAEVFADDQTWIDLLAAHGFTADPIPRALYTVRSLAEIPAPTLPHGFTLRTVAGIHEAEARAAVHRAVFRKPADKYRSFMTTAPDYRPDLDVVVVAPDGQFAAFAQAWVDVENAIGLFEPVGTHPDFQRQGLASAALYEAMHRMRAAGAREALVYPIADSDARHLYFSVGFQTRNQILSYRKAL